MNQAAVQLCLSDRPSTTIVLEAGFNDLSTFNRRFRNLTGNTPSCISETADGDPEVLPVVL